MVNNKAIIEVNSSIKLFFAVSVMCSDVITNKQKPSRLADVFSICWDVLFAKAYSFREVISVVLVHYEVIFKGKNWNAAL
ncbi:hypothetical protein QO200_04995 [Flavobacterium sp. Arc3]|uniref:hypothetical protein n=1 Tax=Flavobacterium sp. Arc3 TaxID=3046686 RepID=UPI00352EFF3D